MKKTLPITILIAMYSLVVFAVKVSADDGKTSGPIPAADFVRVPSASNVNTTTFEMGDHYGVGDSDELPVHKVILDAFYMCKYEVTNRQYCDFLRDALSAGQIIVENHVVYSASDRSRHRPYFNTHEADSDSQISYDIDGSFHTRKRDGQMMDNHPVVEVSWFGAKAFCDFYGYRLPTEAEWECAARSDNLYYQYPWGSNTIDSSKCNYDLNNPMGLSSYPYTTPVGKYSSPTGFYDMAGNAWEWCSDWYGSYPSEPQTNPTGPAKGEYRVIRGGGWSSTALGSRVAARDGYSPPYYSDNAVGFRVCLDEN